MPLCQIYYDQINGRFLCMWLLFDQKMSCAPLFRTHKTNERNGVGIQSYCIRNSAKNLQWFIRCYYVFSTGDQNVDFIHCIFVFCSLHKCVIDQFLGVIAWFHDYFDKASAICHDIRKWNKPRTPKILPRLHYTIYNTRSAQLSSNK